MGTEWLRSLAEQGFVPKCPSPPDPLALAASSESLAGASASLLQGWENKEHWVRQMEWPGCEFGPY